MELDQKQIKAIILTGLAILAIIVIFLIIAVASVTGEKEINQNINISSGYDSIKQIVEHYNCEYKNDTYSKQREYPTEVDLVFKYDLYENDESKEDFFNKIIKDIANFVNYTNVKLIDTTRDITIEVICERGKIYKIIINGQEDYFIYMDSQLASTKYEKIDSINIMPDDIALIELINNNWSSNSNFGTRESIFQNYNICFDEGIEYRKIGSNIFNVVYTKKHTGPVINGLSVGIDLDDVEDYLGKPAFKDEDLNIIGYKGGNLYAFFTKDEISIYRYIEYDYKDFWKLCDKFLEEELDFKEFMNELTYLWGDYSYYTYDSDYMFISYPNRGIDVKLNYEEISGIVLYNNISENIQVVRNYLNHTEFVSRLQLDNVFEAEKRRVETENNLETLCTEFETALKEEIENEEELITKQSYYYNYYIEKDNNENTITTYFISKDGNNVNRELNEPIDTYVWVDNQYFIYSIFGVGLYSYNLADGVKTTLIESNKDFKINSYSQGILRFDNSEEINLGY